MALKQFSESDTSLWRYSYGTGKDGVLTVSADTTDSPIDSACSGSSGSSSLTATNVNFAPNQIVIIYQTSGATAGLWELGVIGSYSTGTITLKENLVNTYTSSGGYNKAQVMVVKQYSGISINSGKTLTAKAWDGTVGGILAYFCSGVTTIAGSIVATSKGFRPSGSGHSGGEGKNGYSGNGGYYNGVVATAPGGGGNAQEYSGRNGGGASGIGTAGAGGGDTQGGWFDCGAGGGGGGGHFYGGGAGGGGGKGVAAYRGGEPGLANAESGGGNGGNGASSYNARGGNGGNSTGSVGYTGSGGSGAYSDQQGGGGAGGGGSYGQADLQNIFFGSSGGSGGNSNGQGTTGKAGGYGGGNIFTFSPIIRITGFIKSDGSDSTSSGSQGAGGGGAGGSILLKGNILEIGSNLLSVSGGAGGAASSYGGGGGNGSIGRIRIEYGRGYTGTSTVASSSKARQRVLGKHSSVFSFI